MTLECKGKIVEGGIACKKCMIAYGRKYARVPDEEKPDEWYKVFEPWFIKAGLETTRPVPRKDGEPKAHREACREGE